MLCSMDLCGESGDTLPREKVLLSRSTAKNRAKIDADSYYASIGLLEHPIHRGIKSILFVRSDFFCIL